MTDNQDWKRNRSGLASRAKTDELLRRVTEKRREGGRERVPVTFNLDADLARRLGNFLDTHSINRSSLVELLLEDAMVVADVELLMISRQELMGSFAAMMEGLHRVFVGVSSVSGYLAQLRDEICALALLEDFVESNGEDNASDRALAVHREGVHTSLRRVQYIYNVLEETYGDWREFLEPLRGSVLHEISDLDNAIALCASNEGEFRERGQWITDILAGKQTHQGMTYLAHVNWYTRKLYGLPPKPGVVDPTLSYSEKSSYSELM